MPGLSSRESRRRVHVLGILGAGACGGALAGLAEALWVIWLGVDWGAQYGYMPAAAMVYAPIGALAAAPLVLPLWLVRRRWAPDAVGQWALAFGWTLAAFTLVIFRFRVRRDLFHEVPLGLAANAACAVVALALVAGAALAVPPLLRRLRLGALPVSIGLLSLFIATSFGLAHVLPTAGTSEFRPLAAAVERPSILFLMVDTLRADHTGPYGSPYGSTPGMEMLARDGVVFERAIAQAPWTRPSVATMLTSWPPHRHGARFKAGSIDRGAVSLVEVLNRNGYYCAGLYTNGHVGPEWGFGRGYHSYHRTIPLPSGPYLSTGLMGLRAVRPHMPSLGSRSEGTGTERHLDAAPRILAERPDGAPVFLYLHFMDTHDPYRSHGRGGGMITRPAAENPGPEAAERYRAAYVGEIRYLDGLLHNLFRTLVEAGLYDDLLIVLVSDHGEEFFEHGGYWHGLTLYEEQLHVPLIVKLPRGRLAGRRQPATVRLLDLAPTIAAAVGLDPPPEWMGTALIGDDGLRAPPAEVVLSETDLEAGWQRSLRHGAEKLILARGANSRDVPPRSLFDLERDPGERENLEDRLPERGRSLEAALVELRNGALWD